MFTSSLFSIFTLIFIFHRILSENDLANSNSILIQNGFVTCYEDHLVIHFYYFPLGDKTIKYSNIHSCQLLRDNDLNFFQIKSWGMAFSSIWWPLDMRRHWRKYYIILDNNQWPKIGITMDDQDTIKVYQLIKQKLN